MTAQDAIKLIGRGINIGNTLDPPEGEGKWNNGPVQEYYFDDYKAAGFTLVRIPVTWYKHVATTYPYNIDSTWLNRVEQIVDWGLSRGLYIILNAHHEDPIKNNYIAEKARFEATWAQISERFKNKSEKLFFEIINEPRPIGQGYLNELNARILGIIRQTNPTRIVIFSGINYSNSWNLIKTKIPGVNDKYLMAYFHSYDPWNFAGLAKGTYGSAADINATIAKFDSVASWSSNNNIPVILGEYGAVTNCDYNSKMRYLSTVTEEDVKHNFGTCYWDDGSISGYTSYNRSQRSWNDNKDAIIYANPLSPNNLSLSVDNDTTVTITWQNRTNLNGTINIERKIKDSAYAVVGTVGATDTTFTDVVKKGYNYYYRLHTTINDSADLYSYPQMARLVLSEPFNKLPATIPGTIEAENYDIGIEGITYHDIDAFNDGGKYRADGIDIELCADTGGGYDVGYTSAGEWLLYTVNVTKDDNYILGVRIASSSTGKSMHILLDNKNITGTIKIPNTLGWQTWQTVFVPIGNISAGTKKMKVIFDTDGFNLNYINFSTTTSINSVTENIFQAVVYPNPSTGHFTITLNKPLTKGSDIQIIDFSGRIIATTPHSQISDRSIINVDISNCNKGLYIVKDTKGSFAPDKIIIK
jgi:aryl-phospho-beta-D-glucosidase BglC (GH1 family)